MYLFTLFIILTIVIIIDNTIIKNGKQQLRSGVLEYQKYDIFFFRLFASNKLNNGMKKIKAGKKRLNLIIKISLFIKTIILLLLITHFVCL